MTNLRKDSPSAPRRGIAIGSAWVGLWLKPLDVLFFRDARPFGAASRAEGGLPAPRTLAGAIRTALLRSLPGFAMGDLRAKVTGGATIEQALRACGAPEWLIEARFRGPWLARSANTSTDLRSGGEPPEPFFPPPVNLYRKDREPDSPIHRSDPLPEGIDCPGWEGGAVALRPVWMPTRGKPHRLDGSFVSLEGIREYLRGGVPVPKQVVAAGALYEFDRRVGLEINAESLIGERGQLVGLRFLSLAHGVGFYAEITWPRDRLSELEGALDRPFPWGGEGRHSRALVLGRTVDWPGDDGEVTGDQPAETARAEGTSIYLLTTPGLIPATVPGGLAWPAELTGPLTRPVALAAGTSVAYSGWDAVRGIPRPTRFAHPAGTVFFVEGASFPGGECLGGDREWINEGWGHALRGTTKSDQQ